MGARRVAGAERKGAGRAEAVRVRAPGPLDAAWARAPLVPLRYPSLLLAIFLSAVVVGTATAAAPLFLSSAGSAALRGGIERASRWEAGLTVTAYGRVTGGSAGGASSQELFLRRSAYLRQLVAGVSGLGPEVVTILGTTATVAVSRSPVAGSAAGTPPGTAPTVQLIARSGASTHVQAVAAGRPACGCRGRWPRPSGSGPVTGWPCRWARGRHRNRSRASSRTPRWTHVRTSGRPWAPASAARVPGTHRRW